MKTTPVLDSPHVADFMRENHRAFLFCRDDARRPIGYAMHAVAYQPATRCLYFASYTKSAKVRHLRADPEVACLVLSGGFGDDDARWVSVHGVAEVYQPSPAEVDDMIGTGSPDGRVPDFVAAKVRDRLLGGKRSFIRLALSEVRAAHLPIDGDAAGDRHGH
jgi:Pyridoxamine 5'-phosphate oxidase